MASTAPITDAPAGAPPTFSINGTMPFLHETPGDYIDAAHAVACLGAANSGDGDEFYSPDPIVVAAFDVISLLLAHAARLMAGRSH